MTTRPTTDAHHPSHYRRRDGGATRTLLTQRLAAAGPEHLPALRQALAQETCLKRPHPRIVDKLAVRIHALAQSQK